MTFWYCEVCEKGGTVEHGRHLDAWSGVNLIYEAHHAASPICPELYKIRVSIPKQEMCV